MSARAPSAPSPQGAAAGADSMTAGAAGAGLPPRVSVVVPTCRRPPLLLRCLAALAAQTLPADAFEIIVVDDGHDEATRRAVEQFARQHPPLALRYLRPAAGRGPAVARNHGWRAAHADLVAFTDDDTIPDPGWLAEGARAIGPAPAPPCGAGDAAAGGWSALAGRVEVPRPPGAHAAPTDHELMTQGLESTEFVTANAFVWGAALQRIGGFDERFTRAWREDSDLQFRLQREVGPVGRCETAVVRHPVRAEPWGVSLRQQKNVFFDALLYRKHPRLYRERLQPAPPWPYFAIVAGAVAAPLLALAGAGAAAATCLAGAALLVLRFAWHRLRRTSRAPRHVAEMLATSALIPFLSVYWRLRGALHFRVWFL